MFCCDGERVLNHVALTVFVLLKDYLIKRYSEFVLLMLAFRDRTDNCIRRLLHGSYLWGCHSHLVALSTD